MLFRTCGGSTMKTSVSRTTNTLAVRPGFYTLTSSIVKTKVMIARITCKKKRGLLVQWIYMLEQDVRLSLIIKQ